MPAEIMPRPAETNAEKPCYLVNRTNTMIITLGRVFPLLQGLGGYTRGCADAPHGKSFTNSRDKTPNKQAKGTPHQRNEDFITLASKDYKGLPARSR